MYRCTPIYICIYIYSSVAEILRWETTRASLHCVTCLLRHTADICPLRHAVRCLLSPTADTPAVLHSGHVCRVRAPGAVAIAVENRFADGHTLSTAPDLFGPP